MVHDLTVRSPRRRVHAPGRTRDLALAAVRDVHRPHRLSVLARRRERDLLVVRRPGWHVVVGRSLRQLTEAARPGVQHPDVVVAAERVAAVGRKRDARAVVRPDRLAIVEGSPGQLVLIRSVGRDSPDVVSTVTVREEADPLAVGRPGRLTSVVVNIGDACGRTAGGRQRPDAALQIDGERTAVGRHGHGHRGAFVDGDVDRRRWRRLRPREHGHETEHADLDPPATHDGLASEKGPYPFFMLQNKGFGPFSMPG